MKQISMKQIALVFALLGLAACSGGGGGGNGTDNNPNKPAGEYQTDPAAGAVNGAAWTFLSGTAKPQFNDPSRMALTLNDEMFNDPCSGFNFGKANILTGVPAAIGETVLGQMPVMQTVTFSYPDPNGGYQNLVATEGRVAVTAITAEEVTGFIIARYNGANYINGAFKLKVCAQ